MVESKLAIGKTSLFNVRMVGIVMIWGVTMRGDLVHVDRRYVRYKGTIPYILGFRAHNGDVGIE